MVRSGGVGDGMDFYPVGSWCSRSKTMANYGHEQEPHRPSLLPW